MNAVQPVEEEIRVRPGDLLTREQIRALTNRTDLAGWLTVTSEYGPALMIAGALQLAAAPLLRPTLRVIAFAPVLFGLGFGWHDVLGTVA